MLALDLKLKENKKILFLFNLKVRQRSNLNTYFSSNELGRIFKLKSVELNRRTCCRTIDSLTKHDWPRKHFFLDYRHHCRVNTEMLRKSSLYDVDGEHDKVKIPLQFRDISVQGLPVLLDGEIFFGDYF